MLPKSLGSLALFAALAGCNTTPPAAAKMTPADIEEISALVTAAQTKADAFVAARDRGLREAARNLVPRLDALPCPEKIPRPEPLGDSDLDLKGEALVAHDAATWRMNVVPDWAVAGGSSPEPLKPIQKAEAAIATLGPRHDQFNRQSAMVRRLLTEGKYSESWSRDELLKVARELGTDAYWGWELDVVTMIKSAPTHEGAGTFEGGILFGKAYLWSFPLGRVLCVADVKATNQDKLKLTIDPNDKTPRQNQRLNDDLKNEAYRAAISALVLVPAP
jgi:hypothetical protein